LIEQPYERYLKHSIYTHWFLWCENWTPVD